MRSFVFATIVTAILCASFASCTGPTSQEAPGEGTQAPSEAGREATSEQALADAATPPEVPREEPPHADTGRPQDTQNPAEIAPDEQPDEQQPREPGGPDEATTPEAGSDQKTTPDQAASTDPRKVCGAFTAGDNLTVCSATYLGGAGQDVASAVEIAADGSILVAGRFDKANFGVTPISLARGGSGAVIRLDPTGRSILSITRIGETLLDMQRHPQNGQIAVVGGKLGLAMLSPKADKLLWQAALPGASRVALGADGTVAALASKTISLYAADGAALTQLTLQDSTIKDLAVYSPDKLVIVTGFNQVSGKLQQPFLRAYDYQGKVKWKNYEWSATQAGSLSSDTRGNTVSIGLDGKLYYAGESHGGVTTHFKDPRDLSKNAPIVRYDKYNQSNNWNGAAPLAFFARFDAKTGTIEQGQLIAPRLSSGKGNGSSPRAITADAKGNILVAGSSACCIANYSKKTINQTPCMPGYGGGGFIMLTSPDFKRRLAWTAWTRDSSNVAAVAVAAGAHTMAVVQIHNADAKTGSLKGSLLTSHALQQTPAGGMSDAFLSVWRTP